MLSVEHEIPTFNFIRGLEAGLEAPLEQILRAFKVTRLRLQLEDPLRSKVDSLSIIF